MGYDLLGQEWYFFGNNEIQTKDKNDLVSGGRLFPMTLSLSLNL